MGELEIVLGSAIAGGLYSGSKNQRLEEEEAA